MLFPFLVAQHKPHQEWSGLLPTPRLLLPLRSCSEGPFLSLPSSQGSSLLSLSTPSPQWRTWPPLALVCWFCANLFLLEVGKGELEIYFSSYSYHYGHLAPKQEVSSKDGGPRLEQSSGRGAPETLWLLLPSSSVGGRDPEVIGGGEREKGALANFSLRCN